MEFDKQRLMDNIYALIQDRGIKIGELENEIGVSTGYISRLNKNSESAVSVEIVWKIAKFFGVSVDMLVEGDMSKARNNLQFMGRFINALKEKTDTNRLEWSSIYIEDIDHYLRISDPVEFPIITTRSDEHDIKEMKSYEYQGKRCSCSAYRKKVLISAAAPHEMVVVTDTSYRVNISNDTEVYIFPMLACFDTQEGGVEKEYFDLYMKKWDVVSTDDMGNPNYDWITYPICNTLNNASDLENQIQLLYRAIARHEGDLRIDENVKDTINLFMGLM